MRKLPVSDFGTEAQGIRLYGDPQRQIEPPSVRIAFPGGEVSVERTSTNDYWVHVRVNSQEDVMAEAADIAGKLTDARLDIHGTHTSLVNVGDFNDPNLYHLAVRVSQS